MMCEQPGWFRIVFSSVSKDALTEGMFSPTYLSDSSFRLSTHLEDFESKLIPFTFCE